VCEAWVHEAPDKEDDSSGKQAIVKHICFDPLEARISYKLKGGQYCREIHFIEGLQAGELYTEYIGASEMIEMIDGEIAFCKKYGDTYSVKLLQVEREKIKPSEP